jgi:hypothetical protein
MAEEFLDFGALNVKTNSVFIHTHSTEKECLVWNQTYV